MRRNILQYPQNQLIEHHKEIANKIINRDDLIAALGKEQQSFPDESVIWPEVLKTKINIIINIRAKRVGSVKLCPLQDRPKSSIIYTRVVRGDSIKEQTEDALAIIRHIKMIAEEFTALQISE